MYDFSRMCLFKYDFVLTLPQLYIILNTKLFYKILHFIKINYKYLQFLQIVFIFKEFKILKLKN